MLQTEHYGAAGLGRLSGRGRAVLYVDDPKPFFLEECVNARADGRLISGAEDAFGVSAFVGKGKGDMAVRHGIRERRAPSPVRRFERPPETPRQRGF